MTLTTRNSTSATAGQAPGFTIIELMLVIAVISILLLVAIPAFQSYTVKAKISEGLVVANPVLKAIAEFHHERGTWPLSNAEAGVSPPGSFATDIVTSVEVVPSASAPTSVLITFNASKLSGINVGENTITYTPSADATRTVQWSCAGGSLPRWARPPVCRS